MSHRKWFLPVVYFLSFSSIVREAKANGCSLKLVHRDSPLSPLYTPSKTQAERNKDAFLLAVSRAKYVQRKLVANQETIVSETIPYPSTGQYLMQIFIGTPPTEVFAFADTALNIVYAQCVPCPSCYPQKTQVFNPTSSSTYSALPCLSPNCTIFANYTCGTSNQCLSQLTSTSDSNSYSSFVLSSDTFGFYTTTATQGASAYFPNSLFGCVYSNPFLNTTNTIYPSAAVGLGPGPLSLISQLRPQIGYTFCYCLVPSEVNASSLLKIGSQAVIPPGTIIASTPILTSPEYPSYYVSLLGVAVGSSVFNASNQNQGNMVIDTGTYYTHLDPVLYSSFETAMRNAINLQPVPDPYGIFNLCYNGPVTPPGVALYFPGLILTYSNVFIPHGDLSCLSILPSSGTASVLGSLAQQNQLVAFDLNMKQVSFANVDCIKVQ